MASVWEPRVRVEQGSTHEAVRRHNLSVVLRQLHLRGPLSRSELAARTELNRSTIKVLVRHLTELGLVAEGDLHLRGTRGRPSPMVDMRDDGPVALALEIAVNSVAVAVVGLGGRVRHLRRATLATHRSASRTDPNVVLAMLRDLAADVSVHDAPGGRAAERVAGVGVAVVGIVRGVDGFVHVAPNLGWRDLPLGELVRTDVVGSLVPDGVPVAVGNEADLGLLAEHARGAAQGCDDVIYLSGEVGIGGGIVAGGRRLIGTTGYAGEIGHLPVNPGGELCGCGGRGCWETVAGQRALLRLAGMSDDAAVADDGGAAGDAKTGDAKTGDAGADDDAVARVVSAAQAGEPAAVRAVTEVGRWLGTGLAGLVNVFNPERIVLGGLYGRAFGVLEPVLTEALTVRALPTSSSGVSVVPAALGVDAPLVGAAELALAPLLNEPGRRAAQPVAIR